jgi:Ca2+-binding RTX toxin-like protein
VGSSHNDILDATNYETAIQINGSGGNDFIYGTSGDDTLSGDHGINYLYGNGGSDTATDRSTTSIIANLNSNQLITTVGTSYLYSIENLRGNIGNDSLTGNANNNILDGQAGNDSLVGGAGDDRLFTGTGADTLEGGAGNDYLVATSNTYENNGTRIVKELTGGEGADTFVLNAIGRQETSFTFEFNQQQLADWINNITLPNEDIEYARLATNLVFDGLGAAAGLASGGLGFGLSFLTSAISTGINFGFDRAQIEAQLDTAAELVETTDPASWIDANITTFAREEIIIKDFEIGVDRLTLPLLSEELQEAGYRYVIDDAFELSSPGSVGIFINTPDNQERRLATIERPDNY